MESSRTKTLLVAVTLGLCCYHCATSVLALVTCSWTQLQALTWIPDQSFLVTVPGRKSQRVRRWDCRSIEEGRVCLESAEELGLGGKIKKGRKWEGRQKVLPQAEEAACEAPGDKFRCNSKSQAFLSLPDLHAQLFCGHFLPGVPGFESSTVYMPSSLLLPSSLPTPWINTRYLLVMCLLHWSKEEVWSLYPSTLVFPALKACNSVGKSCAWIDYILLPKTP